MPWIDIPTEQTTAVTDLMIALTTAICCWQLARRRTLDPWKVQVWLAALGLLIVASVLGAVAHGLQISDSSRNLLWQPLNLALGLVIALFVVGAVRDARGQQVARRVLPWMLAVGLLFFVCARAFPGTFLVFVFYQAVALVSALLLYVGMAFKGKPGAGWITAGIIVTLIASTVQALGSAHMRLIWEFDHNGIFHLIQLPGIVFLTLGILASLRESDPGERHTNS